MSVDGKQAPSGPAARKQNRQPGARAALLVLTAVNLLNFVDRYVASSIKELLQRDLHMTDAESAYPTTGMVLVYMVFAAAFGMMADRDCLDRRSIIATGVMLWSVATALAGTATNLWQFVLYRSLVGVGEAAYGVISTPMIGDFYPQKDRMAAFSIFNLAVPVGGACGYAAGAVLAARYGWRFAFCLVGAPGVAAAIAILTLRNPPRGGCDGNTTGAGPGGVDPLSRSSTDTLIKMREGCCGELLSILENPHYLVATAGQVANVFALGGLADWANSFIVRRFPAATIASAGLAVGAVTVLSGIGGNLLGTKVTTLLDSRVKSAQFLVPAVFMIPGAFFLYLFINVIEDQWLGYLAMLCSQLCIWTYQSPISTLTLNVIPPQLRARSVGLQIFFVHILGDVISPPIIGEISDATGSLQDGLQVTWVAVLLSSAIWLGGHLFLSPLPKLRADTDDRPSGQDDKPTTVVSLLCGGDAEERELEDCASEEKELCSETTDATDLSEDMSRTSSLEAATDSGGAGVDDDSDSRRLGCVC